MAGSSVGKDVAGIDKTRPTIRAGVRVVGMLVRPHLGPFALSIIGASVFAAGTVFSATVLGWVADEIIVAEFEGGAARSVWLGAVAVLAVAVIRAVGVVTRRYFAGMTSERCERLLRLALAEQYLRQPMSWLRRMPTGRLIAHIDADTRVLVEALHPLPFSVGVIVLAVLAAVRLILIDPLVAAVALLVFPAMMMVNTVYSRVVEKPLASQQQRIAEVAGIAHESFEGALIVKTLGRHEPEVERFDRAAGALEERRRTVGFIRAYMDATLGALPLLATLAVLIIGSYRVRAGAMSAGDVVEVAALFNALAIPMLVFGFLLESLIPSVVTWSRLRPVVEAPRPRASDDVVDLRPGSLDVEILDLDYAFPDQPDELILSGVGLRVDPGEVVAIVGPTGSGKSTLCAAIAGVLDEVSGTVHVGGVPLVEVDPKSRADRIAFVFQEAFLFAGTIRDNIDIRGVCGAREILEACRAAALDDWIRSLERGLDTVIGERGVTVSGGQRQRIALARALIGDAGLVLLDDATSAVDTVVEERILEALRSAAGATMLIVAHRLSTIERADRVVHLVDGRVAGIGHHEELLDSPTYRELVMAYAEAASDA